MALTHLAIIMDGNRRWARANHLASLRGHNQGAETLKQITRDVHEAGIGYLTCFVFSTENWRRPQAEVTGLVGLMQRFLMRDLLELTQQNVQLKIIGDLSAFSDDLQSLVKNAENNTAQNTGLKLTLAVNYGGLDDIAQAAAAADFSGATNCEDKIDILKANLHSAHLPPVDLLIRSGGEKRISNFLMFDLAYAELYFTDILWPDFSTADLKEALEEYQRRDRRFGAGALGSGEAGASDVVKLSSAKRGPA